jgi:hypothetical protein
MFVIEQEDVQKFTLKVAADRVNALLNQKQNLHTLYIYIKLEEAAGGDSSGKSTNSSEKLLWTAPKHIASLNMLLDAGATAEDPTASMRARRLKRCPRKASA